MKIVDIAMNCLLVGASPHKILHHVLLLAQISVELKILIGGGFLRSLGEY